MLAKAAAALFGLGNKKVSKVQIHAAQDVGRNWPLRIKVE
jgi:hypothetical protein